VYSTNRSHGLNDILINQRASVVDDESVRVCMSVHKTDWWFSLNREYETYNMILELETQGICVWRHQICFFGRLMAGTATPVTSVREAR
jgi:hypothetical protein